MLNVIRRVFRYRADRNFFFVSRHSKLFQFFVPKKSQFNLDIFNTVFMCSTIPGIKNAIKKEQKCLTHLMKDHFLMFCPQFVY
jgi:hypothetical protein